jgi:phosphohistidine swiveling domain-containing protein
MSPGISHTPPATIPSTDAPTGRRLAREYGLPAVLGVVGATAMFTDGQRITIDGGTGTVETV